MKKLTIAEWYMSLWAQWLIGIITTTDAYKVVTKLLHKHDILLHHDLPLYSDPRWWYDVSTLLGRPSITPEEIAWVKLFVVAEMSSDTCSTKVKIFLHQQIFPHIRTLEEMENETCGSEISQYQQSDDG